MADIQISDLTTNPANALDDVVAQDNSSGTTYKSTIQKLFDLWTSLTAKTTLTGADQIPLADSAASNVAKKITWTNFATQAWNYLNTLSADTPVDADSIAFFDAGGGTTDKVTLANFKTFLGSGYPLFANSGNHAAPADATTYFFGSDFAGAPNIAGAVNKMFIPVAGTITIAYFGGKITGTLGSNEQFTVSIRLNNTSDTAITAAATADATFTNFSNTGLSLAVAAGDYVEIKIVTPTWGTNPTNVTWRALLWVRP